MNITPVKLWRRQKETASLIGKKGKILLWSIIRIPTSAFMSQAPYPIVIVELENKKRIIGQLVDWQEEDLTAGRAVEIVLRRTHTQDSESVIHYTTKIRPL